MPHRIAYNPKKKIAQLQSVLLANREQASKHDRQASSLPLSPPASTGRRSSDAAADYRQARLPPRQNLDRARAPAGKTHLPGRMRPVPECFPLGEIHTRLEGKDRKLTYPASAPQPEHAIHSARDLLSRPVQFALQPRSQLIR